MDAVRASAHRFCSTTHRVSKPREPEAKRAARVSAPLNIYLWEDTTLRVLPHLAAAGEGAGYGPINARRFHTTITEKYYPDLEVPEEVQWATGWHDSGSTPVFPEASSASAPLLVSG